MQFDQRQTIGFQAAQLARLIANRLREALAPLGLMPAQVAALIEIGRAEGLTQKQLVERLDVEQPGVARTLNGLEADGWILRQAKIGRAQGLYLTDRSRAALPEAARLAAEINGQALAELSRTEQAHLLDRLDELISGLRTA
ncbi:MAG TPA: MarR family transcriptional regulator [Devosia sp.]|jgi:DNA-binding MarR family transcriptional regulator|nr:MarR family transcriptional regulator [Devosia sp.]